MSDYGVIIIGTGAGCGTLVRHLATWGKQILLLERGMGFRAIPRERVKAALLLLSEGATDGARASLSPG